MTKSQPPAAPGDADDDKPEFPWKFSMAKKPKRTKKDGSARKPQKGWGPYRSVPNERAVAFNLQLDVQNLQQEVHNLTALRDILKTKTLIQRHSPEGSLCRVVNEYFQVFRKGVVLQESGRKRLADDRYRDQRAFMHSVMDEQVDLGHGIYGPDVMMEQMSRYSLFLRFICMTGKVDSVVVADDSVMVTYKGTLRFQVLRSTIEMVFPHILGNEWLVSQLVGQLVEAPGHSTFHFNEEGKCVKYDIDMDFVAAFTNVVKDPHLVSILLGQALISENALIGVVDGVDAPDAEEEKALVAYQTSAASSRSACCSGHSTKKRQQYGPELFVASSMDSTACSTACSAVEFCLRVVQDIVEDYFFAFASGYQEDAVLPSEVSQRNFLLQRFASQMQAGVETTVNRVKQRWRALSECFEVLSFQQKGVTQTECDSGCNVCLVESSAAYVLRITFYTIQSVFPHLVSNMPLLDILVGKVIVVPSQISFSVEKSTGRISRVKEKMDFAAAIAELLPDRQDLAYVVSQAFLTDDGVDWGKLATTQAYDALEDAGRSTSRTIRMADILN
jgi:hypothetical protein